MTPPRILVVDDEPDLEALISQKFRRRVREGELDLLFAHDGKHALEVLEENPKIDIVLSDINMPRMDGLTLLERLSEMDALVAYLQMLGTLVDFSTFIPDESR